MTLLFLLYGALAVFLAGNLVRLARILIMPVHLRWELYPVPKGPRDRVRYGGSYFEELDWWTRPERRGLRGELRHIVSELLLFKGVRQHNRQLWFWSWLLHIALYLLVVNMGWAVLVSLLERVGPAAWTSSISPVLRTLIMSFSWISAPGGVMGSLGLIIYRSTSPKMKAFTSLASILNLSVILLLFASGLLGQITDSAMIDNLISLAGALLTFHAPPSVQGFALAHIVILALFLSYFPFTHMTHMYMKFFTYHKVRWDDVPYRDGERLHESIARCLAFPVSWSGPHIKGEGKKNWADVGVEEVNNAGQKTRS